MKTLHDVLRVIVEEAGGDIIPDLEIVPGVWHTVRFSTLVTEDGDVFYDDAAVIPDDPDREPQ